MFNTDLRSRFRAAGLYGYEVAAAIGMSESQFSRMIARSELSPDKKAEILKAVRQLVNKREFEYGATDN